MATPKNEARSKSVKRRARALLGQIPATKPILPKIKRAKPKHKKPPGEE